MKQLEKVLSSFFASLPNLPASIREFLVKIAPYFAVIGFILSLPAILSLIGLGSFASVIAGMGGNWANAGGTTLAIIFSILSTVLLGMSISGLFARHMEGWRYSYYNALAGGVYAILRYDLGGLIIGTGISLYVLFQIRSSYK
ncbi:MAG: hypothetical protein KBC02_03360 [Candidatus Pacebacteria bacterium]|nr:hypothetical protein [Candidatus Paceibacterota bacterium]